MKIIWLIVSVTTTVILIISGNWKIKSWKRSSRNTNLFLDDRQEKNVPLWRNSKQTDEFLATEG